MRALFPFGRENFYPRPPRGGRRGPWRAVLQSRYISIHALREEGDVASQARLRPSANFYPRPPRGGRQYLQYDNSASQKDFYPRPPRGGRRQQQQGQRQGLQISIHALREEGDGSSSKGNGKACKFLSTPSARRATSPIPTWRICDHISIHALREEGDPGHGDKSGAVRNFYPRPPRGGRLLIAHPPCTYLTFLSTPSARRATRGTSMKAATKTLFLSTPSARRATGAARAAERSRQYFYPRPPRGGRPQRTAGRKQRGDFYPRPPRGGRREGKLTAYTRGEFLSTPSARRATSIRSMCCSPGAYFYPRPPRGGRPPVGTRKAACHELFLSTPSARRTTVSVSPEAAVLPNFYPRPPRGGRLPPC